MAELFDDFGLCTQGTFAADVALLCCPKYMIARLIQLRLVADRLLIHGRRLTGLRARLVCTLEWPQRSGYAYTIGSAFNNLASLYTLEGQLSKALDAFEQSLRIAKQTHRHREQRIVGASIARVLGQQGRRAVAKRAARTSYRFFTCNARPRSVHT